MSNAAQSWAWQQMGLLSSDKIVLVALADNAWEDGSNAWPSVGLLVKKTGLCRRTVQTALRRLAEAGRIAEQAPAVPDKSLPTTYRLVMDPGAVVAPPGAADTPDPAQTLRDPCAFDDDPPAHLTTDPCAAVAPELSSNQVQVQPDQGRSASPKRAKPRTKLPTPFFLNAELRSWATEKYPDVDVNTETEQFVDHHRGKGTLAADWPSTWRTWIRNAHRWSRNRASPTRAEQRTAANLSVASRLEAREQGEIA